MQETISGGLMASKPTTISVSQFRTNLPEILNRVRLLNESFIIMKHNKPYATVRPAKGGEEVRARNASSGNPVKSAV